MILVLYVDNIFLISNDMNILIKTKLSKHFKIKDLENASFVLDIEIHDLEIHFEMKDIVEFILRFFL